MSRMHDRNKLDTYLYFYLTSQLGGVGGQNHGAGILLPGKSPGSPLPWIGRSAGLDECGKFCLHRDSNSEPSKP